MKANLFLTVLVFISSCAQYGTNTGNLTKDDHEKALDAMEYGNLTKLKQVVGDTSLEGQSSLHNFLVLNSCNRMKSQTNEDIAAYLVEKGARPVEEKADHPGMEETEYSSPLTLSAPIESLSRRGGCEPLLQFYLDHMSAPDVAKGTRAYKAYTSAEIMNWEKTEQIRGRQWEYDYLVDIPKIYKNLAALEKKNSEYCRKGLKENCDAVEHIKNEAVATHTEVAKLSHIRACSALGNIQAQEELMDKQVEFGERTGVASPKTYDAHLQEAQTQRAEMQVYTMIFQSETGRPFNPRLCVF